MKLRITVEGRAYEVDVEVVEGGTITAPPLLAPATPASSSVAPAPRPAARPAKGAAPAGAPGDKVCKSPIAGNITQVKVKAGDQVAINQVLIVMEAMKMETNIASPVAGKVKAVNVKPGEAVKSGQVLVEFE